MRLGQSVLSLAILVAALASCSDDPTCEETLTCEASPSDEVAADRPNQDQGGAPNLTPTDTGGAGANNTNGGNPSQGGNSNSPSLPTPDGGGRSTSPTMDGGSSGTTMGGNGATDNGGGGNVGGTAGTRSSDASAGTPRT